MTLTFHDDRGVRDLLARYCVLLDANRTDELGEIFTEDCAVDFIPGTTIHGLAAVIAHLTERMRPVAATSHHLSNTVLSETGDGEVAATSYLYAWHRYRDGRPDGTVWGHYEDVARRTTGGWRLARRTLVVHGMEGFDRPEMHMLHRLGHDAG